MFEFDTLTAMTLVLLGVYLLAQASQRMALPHGLAPFRLEWILAGLLWLMPFAEKGSVGAIAVFYLLLGTLILNILVLYSCSRLPDTLVPVKSREIEFLGGLVVQCLGTGLRIIGKSMLGVLFQWIDALVQPCRSAAMARLNGV
jgi:hypothetical protein